MDVGDLSNGTASEPPKGSTSRLTPLIIDELSGLSLGDDEEAPVEESKPVKDPRRIARKYQINLCEKALEENVIVYLGTGCGKTHIAVLLMHEMGHLIRKPKKNVCVFLAPTVALVEQQAKVIEESVDFKVATYCGNLKHLKNHHDWEKELEHYEVLVMTPQILLQNLSHCFIRMEKIALLIFDECHYAQTESNHPYAEIMKIFYNSDSEKLPRIFGMTASPKLGKGASIQGLENVLRAKVYSVEDKDELDQFVASPKVNVYYYRSTTDGPVMIFSNKLERLKHQFVTELHKQSGDQTILRNTKKSLQRCHSHLIFCLENLGLWGALQASRILLKGDNYESYELFEPERNGSVNSLCDNYLIPAAAIFASGCNRDGVTNDLELLEEPFFSKKLLLLIQILSNFRVRPDMKCIIFVNRIVTARSLSCILQNLKLLTSWKCGFLAGVHSGLKSMSRKNTNTILDKFRSGELNLLVATKVGEEGLDIQTCCLVIRFDLPETVASFIQSRGRARMPISEYAFMVNSDNLRELQLINHFKRDEAQMNEEILTRKSSGAFSDFNEKTYKVDATGATISSASSISLLHRYCSKLPHDEFFIPKPQFYYIDDTEGTICRIILPANAAIHQIESSPHSSIEAARKDACLKACKTLHELGALSDYLLIDPDDRDDSMQDFSDSEDSDDEGSRKELHEMLVPDAFKESWSETESPVCLHSYYIKFSPNPVDRDYKKFGLFVKAALPRDAESMRLDIHLARGRSIMTVLFPHGVVKFDANEIKLAEQFQQMFLKAILDRKELIPEFVSLERKGPRDSSSTFFLLLPVNLHKDNKFFVDWKLVRRCLSSPIFKTPEDVKDDGISQFHIQLQLANGPKSRSDVVNSLVYMPCKEKEAFFFIADIVVNKDGYSLFKDSRDHVTHYADQYGIHLLYPEQPLLKAKPLFCPDNLLRKKGNTEMREKEEYFVELPPELCQLKIIGFSKDIGSSLSILPSFMHRLESLLIAIELRKQLAAAFPEGGEVTLDHVLEALTTEKCLEHFSLERLEVLGDAFLKFAVGRHIFLLNNALDEGQLTKKRSKIVCNSNLHKLAIKSGLQVYIRDHTFEPDQFYALGRPCPVICSKQTEDSIHMLSNSSTMTNGANSEVRCSKSHRWLMKKTIADVVEALIGAFIVDGGFKAATAFLKWIGIQVDFSASQVINVCSASTRFMALADKIDLTGLEKLLDHDFVHKGLLIQAFIHPSYNHHGGGCYQRLEFLGDAVLDYLITSYIYSVYPKLKPGQFTDLRSASVNNKTFADIAVCRSLYRHIICDAPNLRESITSYTNFMGKSASEKGEIEKPYCPKVLGDLVESCMGAILLDTGFDLNYVWEIMLSLVDPTSSFSKLQLNSVRELHEFCQSYGWDLKFHKIKNDGQSGIEAEVIGKDVSTSASATNRPIKTAKEMAAEHTLKLLRAKGYKSKIKPLEEVLKTAVKMEPKLVGYNEVPCLVTAEFGNLTLQQISESSCNINTRPLTEVLSKNFHAKAKPMRNFVFSDETEGHSRQAIGCNDGSADSHVTGASRSATAKSFLHEICTANCWKPPVFQCCDESGPSHLKRFRFKVTVEIEEKARVLVAFGEPQLRKKDAAEHAAEGALWFLKSEGYL
nr:dicer-like protein 4 [Ipomoea batatas]